MQDTCKLLMSDLSTLHDRAKSAATPQNINLSHQLLYEALKRLDSKYLRYVESRREMRLASETGINTVAAQDGLVEAIDEYYQQLYVSISKTGQLARYVAINNIDNAPVRSNKRLLEALRRVLPADADYQQAIDTLERAREYRSEYIDHYSGDQSDWMTLTNDEEAFVCHYVPNSDGVIFRSVTSPESQDFKPPVGYESFMVSPNITSTHLAMTNFIDRLFTA